MGPEMRYTCELHALIWAYPSAASLYIYIRMHIATCIVRLDRPHTHLLLLSIYASYVKTLRTVALRYTYTLRTV